MPHYSYNGTSIELPNDKAFHEYTKSENAKILEKLYPSNLLKGDLKVNTENDEVKVVTPNSEDLPEKTSEQKPENELGDEVKPEDGKVEDTQPTEEVKEKLPEDGKVEDTQPMEEVPTVPTEEVKEKLPEDGKVEDTKPTEEVKVTQVKENTKKK